MKCLERKISQRILPLMNVVCFANNRKAKTKKKMLSLTRKYFQILKQLNEGVNIDGVDAKLRLTTLKPLHAQ